MNYIIFGLVLLSSIFIFIIFWVKLGTKKGKTKTYAYAITFLGLVLPLMSVIGYFDFGISLLIIGVIFGILMAIGLAGYFVLPYAIVADIVKEDEQRTGDTSRAGLYYGFESIPLNIFQFIGYIIIGTLLELPNITNYLGQEYSFGYVLFGPISAVFVFISLIIFIKYVNADPSSVKH